MLTVCPVRRSDIGKICTHWWVNESYERNCLDIAEELAAQTPVRLDLLLSLVPQSANADKLVVGEDLVERGLPLSENVPSEIAGPARSYSAGDFMEFERSGSSAAARQISDIEPKSTTNGDAKRKLESTSSMDEKMVLGTKRKEVSKIGQPDDEEQQAGVCKSDSRFEQ